MTDIPQKKWLIFLLILTSLFGYLEWGHEQHSFLFQAEADILSKMWTNPTDVIHPFTVLPMLGQLLLVFSLFQKTPRAVLIWTGMTCIGMLLLFMCIIGLLSFNYKIVLSTLPFIITWFFMIQHLRKAKGIRQTT